MVAKKLNPPIVVGVDGSSESLRATEFAALESARRHCPLVLVHAYHGVTQINPMMPVYTEESARELGHRVLAEARDRVATISPECVVGEQLVRGHAVRCLTKIAQNARFVVIGRNPLTGLSRVLAGSTGTGVASRSPVPVVSVPGSWRDDDGREGVVVGTDEAAAGDVVWRAFDEAELLGTFVIAVRAWEATANWYPDVPMSSDFTASWLSNTDIEMAEELAGYGETFPGVGVERRIEMSSSPADALVREAANARLIVTGSHRSGDFPHPGLGSTAHKVLAHAPCPVLVVPVKKAPHRHSTDTQRNQRGVVAPLY